MVPVPAQILDRHGLTKDHRCRRKGGLFSVSLFAFRTVDALETDSLCSRVALNNEGITFNNLDHCAGEVSTERDRGETRYGEDE